MIEGLMRRRGRKAIAAVQAAHFDDQCGLSGIQFFDVFARPAMVAHRRAGAAFAHRFAEPKYVYDIAGDLMQHQIAGFSQLDNGDRNLGKPKLGAGGPQRKFGVELPAPHHALREYRAQRRQVDKLLTVRIGAGKIENGLKDGVEAPAQQSPIAALLIEYVVGAL